jgi:D-3-phosphoglycerate dehydrogenase
VVVEPALVAALTSGQLAGAALDVFDSQPLAADHPFMGLPNVILTPHMAGITEESMLRMGQGVVAEVRRVLGGALPANLVNPEAVPLYNSRFPS